MAPRDYCKRILRRFSKLACREADRTRSQGPTPALISDVLLSPLDECSLDGSVESASSGDLRLLLALRSLI
jgi:hypothetical protein